MNTEELFALYDRNESWAKDTRIPSWVNVDKVGLDQFFTRPEIASYCYNSMVSWMKKDGAILTGYKFIEPGAGNGAFYDLLPNDRRIGIDILPLKQEFERADFLSWLPQKNGHNYAVIGNPPFGYRAWLALSFINHAALFSDYVGMILPMGFQSDGKGSSKHRVRGLELKSSEILPSNSFVDINDNPVKINALWQIWQRGVNNTRRNNGKCSKWLELFTVDMRTERLCGQKRLHEADCFLQRTFFKEPPMPVKSFSEVRYVCGYGLIIKKDKKRITELLKQTDWRQYSNLAAHNCRHISMYHIRNVLADAGFVDA